MVESPGVEPGSEEDLLAASTVYALSDLTDGQGYRRSPIGET